MSSKDKNIEKTESDTSLDNAGSDNKDSRRSLLKKLAVGGIAGAAMPAKWSKPVIDSVILPAHAQTSDSTVVGGGGGGGAPGGPAPANSIGEEVLDFFTSPASAGEVMKYNMIEIESYCLELTIRQTDNTPTKVTVTKMCYEYCFGASFPDKNRDRNITATPLTGSGSTWSGLVDGHQLNLTNVDTSSTTLAASVYGGMAGTIYKDTNCNCPCETI